jgi:hypothetical protein
LNGSTTAPTVSFHSSSMRSSASRCIPSIWQRTRYWR